MQNQNILPKCQDSVTFFLQEPFTKSKKCKAGFVTWPSKVVGLLDRCQRVEGKISLILSDLEVTVLNHIPQKFNFRKFLYYVALL